MNGKRVYYQVFWDGCPGVVHKEIADAVEDVSESLKVELNDGYEEETGTYKIKAIQMTAEEFDLLPEFSGY